MQTYQASRGQQRLSLSAPEKTRGLPSFGVPFPAPQRPRPLPGSDWTPRPRIKCRQHTGTGRLPAPIPLWDPRRLLLQLLENRLEADFAPSALAVSSTRHNMSHINAKSVSITQRQSANPGPICGHSWSRMLCPTALPNSCVWLPGGSSLHTTRPSFRLLLQAELRTVYTGASSGVGLLSVRGPPSLTAVGLNRIKVTTNNEDTGKPGHQVVYSTSAPITLSLTKKRGGPDHKPPNCPPTHTLLSRCRQRALIPGKRRAHCRGSPRVGQLSLTPQGG